MTTCDVAIIGAGPYGLSIAAHCKALGMDIRIYGNPMDTWLRKMPKGMHLKSEGFASSIYDPGSTFTLAHYCREQKLPYQDIGLPVPLDVFSAYGLEFQKRFVPELEDTLVESVRRAPSGFQLSLGNGQTTQARRVVAAVGLTHFDYLPPALSALPEELVTHSARHHALDRFKGKEVIVVGAGASALDIAALLHQGGASVQLVARKPAVRFHDPPPTTQPSLLERLQVPTTGIGPGWRLYFCVNAPHLFRQLPQHLRFDIVRKYLGPAPGWFVKDQVVGKFPFNLGVEISQAKAQGGRVSLDIADASGARRTLTAHHVIAATGYRVDLRRLGFLEEGVRSDLKAVEHTPVLSSYFESSVPGLYFVGTAAANTFGPVLRFAYGAGYTARRISGHLAKGASPRAPESAAPPKVEERDHDEVYSR